MGYFKMGHTISEAYSHRCHAFEWFHVRYVTMVRLNWNDNVFNAVATTLFLHQLVSLASNVAFCAAFN